MSTPIDPPTLARDLRGAMRPLWRRLKAHKSMSAGKVGILAHLRCHGGATATDLATHERISQQAASAAIAELAELGLVDREPDPADRRRTLVTITDAGFARLDDELEAGQDWLVRAIEETLDDDEQATLAAAIPLLRRLDTEAPSKAPQ